MTLSGAPRLVLRLSEETGVILRVFNLLKNIVLIIRLKFRIVWRQIKQMNQHEQRNYKMLTEIIYTSHSKTGYSKTNQTKQNDKVHVTY